MICSHRYYCGEKATEHSRRFLDVLVELSQILIQYCITPSIIHFSLIYVIIIHYLFIYPKSMKYFKVSGASSLNRCSEVL